jgi:uroporphyrinogen-III synthase
VTAHDADGKVARAQADTLVYYMGTSRAEEIVRTRRSSGWADDTPVMIVSCAGSASERSTSVTLGTLAGQMIDPPAVIIAGKVTATRYPQPKYLFTGLDPYQTSLRVPGRIVHYPLIELEEVNANGELPSYDALVFTSKHAVRFFMKRFDAEGRKVFAIGPATQHELSLCGIDAECPDEPNADSLAALLGKKQPGITLYPCSDLSHNAIHELPFVKRLDLYRVKGKHQRTIDLASFNGIIFTSPSTVRQFHHLYGEFPPHAALYCMGPATHGELKRHHAQEEHIIDVQTIQTETD